MTETLLTAEEVAEILRISYDSCARMLRERRLPGVKIGRRWYVRQSDFDALFDRESEPAPTGKG